MSGTLDNTTSWLPVDETADDILLEAISLISTTTMVSVAYGIVVTLFIICANALVQKIRAGKRRKQALYILIYITIMVMMGTIYCALCARQTQLEYVNNRNYPGGPNAYSLYLFDTALDIVADTAFFMASWMNDALLLWRLSVLYKGSRFHIPVVVGGVILYLAVLSLGLVTLIESSLPSHTFWTDIAVTFATACYSMSTAYTIVLTLFMVVRIISVRTSIINATGRSEFGGQYLSVVAMIIESSALYTVWGIIFLALYLSENAIANVFLATLSEVQIIAPLLIIYRVSQGKAWDQDTNMHLTSHTARVTRGQTGYTAHSNTLNSSNTLNIVVDKEVQSMHDSKRNAAIRAKGDEYELDAV